jgi:hypothetical protein
MIRATLEDRKGQTRRVIKPQFGKLWGQGVRHGAGRYAAHVDIAVPDGWKWLYCPYGKTGDRLWVRETWADSYCDDSRGNPITIYRADYPDDVPRRNGVRLHEIKWRPSIFMPRALSRITLEVTGVRVERLKSISLEDMRAEGLRPNNEASLLWRETLAENFRTLWDTINPKHPWSSNPWTWVVEFKRVEKETV